MTSSRPYLLRALYEWIADNDMTPHVLVDATVPGVQVPPHVVQDGKVTLNVDMQAVSGLSLDNDAITFAARFAGVSHQIHLPPSAVLAIYARENGQGMMFPPEEEGSEPDRGGGDDDRPTGPTLRVVK